MICFCPSVIFCIFKSVFTNLVKCATWIFSLICKSLQFISAAVISAYEARQVDEQLDNDVTMPEDPIVWPFLQTGLVFNNQPDSFIDQVDHYNEQFSSLAAPQPAEFCDPSSSIQCPPDSS